MTSRPVGQEGHCFLVAEINNETVKKIQYCSLLSSSKSTFTVHHFFEGKSSSIKVAKLL